MRAYQQKAKACRSGSESLKLTKLADNDDIEAFLMTFERAFQAHSVEGDKWAAIPCPSVDREGKTGLCSNG